jgi:AcrR family transcriptional regulator
VIELLKEFPYSKVSVDMIVERAQTTRPALYRRWPSKALLVADAMSRSIPPFSISPEADIQQEMRRIFVELYRGNRQGGIYHVVHS